MKTYKFLRAYLNMKAREQTSQLVSKHKQLYIKVTTNSFHQNNLE